MTAAFTLALPMSMPSHVGMSSAAPRLLDVEIENLTADARFEGRLHGVQRPDLLPAPAPRRRHRGLRPRARARAEQRWRRPEVVDGVDLHASLPLLPLDDTGGVDGEDLALDGDALRELALRLKLDRLHPHHGEEGPQHS